MKRASWVVIGVMTALAGIFGYLWLASGPQPDEEQIRALLADGESAIERRSVRDALACVSKDYSDAAGFNRDGLRLQIIQAFRSVEGYDLTVETNAVAVRGDDAEVQTFVTLATLEKGQRRQAFSGPITIALRKQPTRRYLVVPSSSWKVVHMTGLPLSPEGL